MAKEKEQPGQQAKQQPSAISPELSIVPTKVMAGVYLQRQQFGDWKGARQMFLSEAMEEEEAQERGITVTGLDLSLTEAKVLHAIQFLFSRTGYKGNLPGREADLQESWKWKGYLPKVETTYSEIFELSGLQRKKRGDYYGRQAEEALKALDRLTEPFSAIYERKRWQGKGKARKQVSDIVVRKAPLFTLWKLYEGLEEEEAAQVRAGQELPNRRRTRLVIEAGPLLMDGIDDFFFLKPLTLYQEIQEVLGARRISPAVPLFIHWLLVTNLPEISIGKEKLAITLKLDYLIEQRKKSLLDKRLQEAIDTALELEYLLDYKENALGKYTFILNPEMGRPHKWELKEGAEDEEDSSLPE